MGRQGTITQQQHQNERRKHSPKKNHLIQAVCKSDQRNRIANYRASVRNTTVTATTTSTDEISHLTDPSINTTSVTSSTSSTPIHEASDSTVAVSQQSNMNTGKVRSAATATAAKPNNRRWTDCSKLIASNL